MPHPTLFPLHQRPRLSSAAPVGPAPSGCPPAIYEWWKIPWKIHRPSWYSLRLDFLGGSRDTDEQTDGRSRWPRGEGQTGPSRDSDLDWLGCDWILRGRTHRNDRDHGCFPSLSPDGEVRRRIPVLSACTPHRLTHHLFSPGYFPMG